MQRCPETPANGVSRHHTGAPGGIRTPNLLIRSQMLYPLSHGCWAAARPREPTATSKSSEVSAKDLIEQRVPLRSPLVQPGLSFRRRAAAAAGTATASVDGGSA